jgi:hypothetical protein
MKVYNLTFFIYSILKKYDMANEQNKEIQCVQVSNIGITIGEFTLFYLTLQGCFCWHFNHVA